MEKKQLSSLPLNALEPMPALKPDAQRITALVKEGGRVTGYQLADGRIVDKAQGVALARQGSIRGVGIASKYGNQYLKSIPDGMEDNNLGNLPSITK